METHKKNNGVGRPTVMTPEVVNKLEQAFSLGCPITVACEYAGISRETIYDYINKNPEFSDRIKQLQGLIGMRARKSIADAINKGDAKIAFEYLKKKFSDEFGDNPVVEQRNLITEQIVDISIKVDQAIAEMFRKGSEANK